MSLTTRKQALEKGVSRYDTGKPCINGHLSERYTKNGYCCECSNLALKSWRYKNTEKVKAYKEAYRSTIQGKYLHTKHQQNREARKIKASVYRGEEFNDFCLDEAYHLSALRSLELNVPHHVDHIVPLRGKKVCGFHSWNNIQVIPAKENIRKSNHYAGV